MDKLQKNEARISPQIYKDRVLPTVAKIGMVRAYPMSDEETEAWSAMIFKIDDKVTIEELVTVVEGFMTGRYDFEKDLGIRNVFNALKVLRSGDIVRGHFQIP